jgi:site-specific DNA-methyltransferase (adenine-specific)
MMPGVDEAYIDWLDKVVHADSAQTLTQIPSNSIHLILSDIPYGIGAEDWDVLHLNTNSAFQGSSPAQEKAGGVFKKRGKPINGWSEADRRGGWPNSNTGISGISA